jgi:hypothetical protein
MTNNLSFILPSFLPCYVTSTLEQVICVKRINCRGCLNDQHNETITLFRTASGGLDIYFKTYVAAVGHPETLNRVTCTHARTPSVRKCQSLNDLLSNFAGIMVALELNAKAMRSNEIIRGPSLLVHSGFFIFDERVNRSCFPVSSFGFFPKWILFCLFFLFLC